MLIGLTGGIASGKSRVSSFLKSCGAVIIDADEISRQVLEPQKVAWKKIVNRWGIDILLPDLSINRKKLASIVFSNRNELGELNNITHPEIIREIQNRLSLLNKDDNLIILDAPLLIEAGIQYMADRIWLVSVSEETQIKRLIDRDKISVEEAKKRIASQMLLKDKEKYAHIIINNDGLWEDTENFLKSLLDSENLKRRK